MIADRQQAERVMARLLYIGDMEPLVQVIFGNMVGASNVGNRHPVPQRMNIASMKCLNGGNRSDDSNSYCQH